MGVSARAQSHSHVANNAVEGVGGRLTEETVVGESRAVRRRVLRVLVTIRDIGGNGAERAPTLKSPILRHFSPALSVVAPGSWKPRKNGEKTAQNGRKVAGKMVG